MGYISSTLRRMQGKVLRRYNFIHRVRYTTWSQCNRMFSNLIHKRINATVLFGEIESTEREVSWILRLYELFFKSLPLRNCNQISRTIIHTYNTALICSIERESVNARTKHIFVRYHFVLDLHRHQVIPLKFLRSSSKEVWLLYAPLPFLTLDASPRKAVGLTKFGELPSYLPVQTHLWPLNFHLTGIMNLCAEISRLSAFIVDYAY